MRNALMRENDQFWLGDSENENSFSPKTWLCMLVFSTAAFAVWLTGGTLQDVRSEAEQRAERQAEAPTLKDSVYAWIRDRQEKEKQLAAEMERRYQTNR